MNTRLVPGRSPCLRVRTVPPFRPQPPVVAPEPWSGFRGVRAYRMPAFRGTRHPHHWGKTSVGLRHYLAGSPQPQAESGSSSCGPVVHLPLLSTPPHGDAVTFGYEIQTQPRRGLAPRGFDTITGALGHAASVRAGPGPGTLAAGGRAQALARCQRAGGPRPWHAASVRAGPGPGTLAAGPTIPRMQKRECTQLSVSGRERRTIRAAYARSRMQYFLLR